MTAAEAHRASPGHVGFMAVFGLLGWGALAMATLLPELVPATERAPDLFSFGLFFLVVVGVRGMAFRMLPDTVVSLDSAFYIAAAVCLGSATSGRLVALALTADALTRLRRADASGKRASASWVEDVVFVLYFGGMSGGLLMAVGWFFHAGGRLPFGGMERETGVLSAVVLLGLTFLVLHYLIQGARLRITGKSFSGYVRRMALPGMAAEASLLPLAAVVVLIYDPGRPLGFVLLGITYLLVNFFFNQLSRASASLRQRVNELETLNRIAHALGSTLQLHELIETLAKETTQAIPEAEVLALSRRERDGFLVDSYDRERGEFARHRAPAGEGISHHVVTSKQPLHVPDLHRFEQGGKDESGMRSWLGVPITIYDEVVGVLSVQSRERNAFRPDHVRLLEAIGAQAAVAIQNARLYELATVDGLTGLYVRRYFDSRLREELERCRRFGSACSVILLDIDDFKRLNDTHGHPLGDRVLRELGQVVRRSMRGVDLAARYGGEEFAFILPRTGMVDAHAVAERIRQDVADARIAVDGKSLAITASLGVACWPESGEGDAAQVVQRADVALYRAKSTGKNRVELFWPAEAEVQPTPQARRRPLTLG